MGEHETNSAADNILHDQRHASYCTTMCNPATSRLHWICVIMSLTVCYDELLHSVQINLPFHSIVLEATGMPHRDCYTAPSRAARQAVAAHQTRAAAIGPAAAAVSSDGEAGVTVSARKGKSR